LFNMEGDGDMATTTATAPPRADRTGPPPQQTRETPARPADTGQLRRWASLLGGGTLALYGLTRDSLGGMALALLGGGLAYRGATGQRVGPSARGARPGRPGGLRVEHTVSILRPAEELYRFWRNFENHPRFMPHLESVRNTEGNRSHWVAQGPMGFRIEWDSEVTADRPNELIGWRCLPGSALDTEGSVSFRPSPGNRGTWVKVVLRYDPPAGVAGAAIASLFGRSGEQMIREGLRNFKRLLETGEIATARGQPSGRGRERWQQTGSMILQDRFAAGLGWFSIGLGAAELLAPGTVAELIGVRDDHRPLFRMLGAREIATGIGILSQTRPTGWLWGRVAGDAMDLGLLGAALRSPNTRRGRAVAAAATALGTTVLDLLCSLQHTASPGEPKGIPWRRARGTDGRRPGAPVAAR
jgi:uncharacterized membrane protein